MAPPDLSAELAAASLSVAAVARRLGVAPATLRTWDRRYGLGPSAHEPGSHRRYTPVDVERLVVMRRLTLEGVAPVQAAQTAHAVQGRPGPHPGDPLEARAAAPVHDAPAVDLREPGGEGAAGAQTPAAAPGAGGGWSALPLVRTALTRRASPAGDDELQDAALAHDAAACTAILSEVARRRGPLAMWEDLLQPALRALGRRWETTSPGVDTDLLLRAAALDALRRLTAPPLRTSAAVVVAAAEVEHGPSSTVLHVLAAAVRADGVRPWVLAPGLPREAVAATARRVGPRALVLHAERLVVDAATQLAVLPRLRTPARLVLSGPGWSLAHVPDGRSAVHAATLRQALDVVAEATAP